MFNLVSTPGYNLIHLPLYFFYQKPVRAYFEKDNKYYGDEFVEICELYSNHILPNLVKITNE